MVIKEVEFCTMRLFGSFQAPHGSRWAAYVPSIRKLAGFALFMAMTPTVFLGNVTATSAGEETPIEFRNGAPPDGAWPVIERWMRALDEAPPYNFDLLQDHLERIVEFGWAKNINEALAAFLNHELFWAYADLEGDGIDEILVFIAIGPYCGSIGCSTIELHRSGSGWRIEDGITVTDEHDLCYRQKGPNGRPSIRNHSHVYWWSGNEQDGVCYAYCSHWWDRDAIGPDELAAMTPEELKVRDEVRQEPWCTANLPN
jgi:hypothetical protein